METINKIFHLIGAIHINAFYAIVHFFKENMGLLLVLVAIIYMAHQEIVVKQAEYVDDRRRIL